MGVGAERPKTWGESSQKLGRIDHVWGGRGADRPGADRPVPVLMNKMELVPIANMD